MLTGRCSPVSSSLSASPSYSVMLLHTFWEDINNLVTGWWVSGYQKQNEPNWTSLSYMLHHNDSCCDATVYYRCYQYYQVCEKLKLYGHNINIDHIQKNVIRLCKKIKKSMEWKSILVLVIFSQHCPFYLFILLFFYSPFYSKTVEKLVSS